MKMRLTILTAAVLAGGSSAAAGEELLASATPPPLLGTQMAAGLEDAFRPAYRLVETVSDGAFSLVRVQLFNRLLPGRLHRELGAAPQGDSFALFERNFAAKEARLLERLRERYPVAPTGSQPDQNRLDAWRQDAQTRQTHVVADALADTLLDRYGLQRFGRQSENYAKRRQNWDPAFVATAGVIGGGIAYLNGIHGAANFGPVKVDVDMRSGLAIERALRSGTRLSRAAELEIGPRRSRFALAAAWAADNGSLRSDSLGLKYRLRY